MINFFYFSIVINGKFIPEPLFWWDKRIFLYKEAF